MVISSDNYNIFHIFIDHSAAMMIRINYIIYKYICIAISQCPRQPSATPEHFSLFPMPMFCRCSMTSPKIQHFMDGSSQADSDAGTPSGKLTQLWKIHNFQQVNQLDMRIFNSYFELPEGRICQPSLFPLHILHLGELSMRCTSQQPLYLPHFFAGQLLTKVLTVKLSNPYFCWYTQIPPLGWFNPQKLPGAPH